jgi:hypothetical protein
MKRRSFLKAIGAGVGFVMMPSLAMELSKDTTIATCADLAAAMVQMFTCKMGDPRAFMEFEMSEAKQFFTPAAFSVVMKNFDGIYSEKNIVRLNYQTFAYAIEGGDAKEAEKKLANYFYDRFKEMDENDKKMVLWRLLPVFESENVTNYGATWMTSENIEDRTDLRKEYIKNIDGYVHPTYGPTGRWIFKSPNRENEPPIMVPDGVEYDVNTGSLRYVESRTVLHKMRMRFSMPEITFDVANLAKEEGEIIKRIDL